VSAISERVLGNATLYDAVQRAAGLERVRRRLAPVLSALGPGRLLDVGAGTGAFYDLLPSHVQYVPLDTDPRKLERLAEKHEGVKGIVGSATSLPFDDASFDYSMCTSVAHHLTDEELDRMLDELARITRTGLVFLDPLRTTRVASKTLWRIDRGSYPRTYEELVEKLSARFSSDVTDRFTVIHSYLIFAGGPRVAGISTDA
jgi:ubiquinone/menaquinone biosynthesis C-methylase UbiE